jgi:GNAT superfamily N-acetyltransferase
VTVRPGAPHRSEIEYRDAAPSAEGFAALFATTGWDPVGGLDAAAAEAALRHSWFDVTAYEDGRLVGMGRIVGDGVLHALLVDVVVEPSHQSRGIGTGIVRCLVVECRRHRIADVQLFCARGKRPFYEHLGFTARPENAPGMELVDPDPPGGAPWGARRTWGRRA